METQFKLCVVPQEILQLLAADDGPSRGCRLLRLPHPRTNLPCYFYAARQSETSGLLMELHSVSPESERSWLVNDNLISDGQMLLMTPMDPAFLLAALLRQHQGAGTPRFRTADDLLDELCSFVDERFPDLGIDMRSIVSLQCVSEALSRVCDAKDIAFGVTAYSYSEKTWLAYLVRKVQAISSSPLSEKSKVISRQLAKMGLDTSQDTELVKLARIKLACDLLSQYLPTDFQKLLIDQYNLTALKEYTIRILEEDTMTALPPKKSKPQKQELLVTAGKRKAATQASRGVDKLKKVNTVGMSKLSKFFSKPTVA